jgi:putative membrane protein
MGDAWAYMLIAGGGFFLWWICTQHPTALPSWAPWEFSPSWYAAASLAAYWYCRGLARTPIELRPTRWHQLAYFAGIVLLYIVLQTRFDYLAQHMFFLNRVQHIIMHHIGPALIALAWPGAVLRRGMPASMRRLVGSRPIAHITRWVQQPLLAAVLFVGLIALWLYPAVHFRAMIDARLYAVMNWSMVVDGILFWCVILDPRPTRVARVSIATRAILAAGVMYPQIAIGLSITFIHHDLYPFYALCGRAFSSFPPPLDQALGGIIVWVAGSMMSVLAFVYVLYLHGTGRSSCSNELCLAAARNQGNLPGGALDPIEHTYGWM